MAEVSLPPRDGVGVDVVYPARDGSGGAAIVAGNQAGAGVTRYAFDAGQAGASLAHRGALAVGDAVPTGWFDSRRQMGGQGYWEVLDATPQGLAGPRYDATITDPANPRRKRIFIEGAGQVLALIDDGPVLNLARIGLLSDDTAATVGQDAVFLMARDYALGRFDADPQAAIAPQISFSGIVRRAASDPTLDMKMAAFTAGAVGGKLFAKDGMRVNGVNLPYPVIRFGAGTSPQNRSTIVRDVDVHVEGNQDSALSNTATRVIGVELYDDSGAASLFRARVSRCYIGARIKGNVEKKRLKIGGAYNSILCDYVQQRVSMADYRAKAIAAGRTPVADLENWLLLEDGGPSGYKGEWSALLNQQGVATGSAVGRKGAYYKIVTGGTTASIDGRTSWTAGAWLVSDGALWWQLDDVDDTPDTNEVELTGQDNEMLFRTSYNADCSAVVSLLHEGRLYKGGTLEVYRSLTESLTIPTPAILDQGGKWFKYMGHVRAGDSLLFGYTGKSKGSDTTVFDLSDNHVYGQMWHIDEAARIEGQMRWEDCANGRDPVHGLTNVPTPVVRINKVKDAGDFRLSISKATNLGAGADGYAVAGLIIGDEARAKYSTDLNLPSVSVYMGNPQTIATADPGPNTYIAIQVRRVNGLTMVSPELAGRLDYWAGAKKVFHTVPASFVRGRYTVQAHAAASVTLEVDGDLTAVEAFTIAWPASVRILATVAGQRMERIAGKWRPCGAPRVKLIDLQAINSDPNRYYDVGSLVTCEADDELWWLKANGRWRKADGTEITPALMAETTALLTRWSGLSIASPTGADLAKLDRAIFRYVRAGVWGRIRTLRNLRWNSAAADAIKWAGANLAAANVCDPAGHPYDVSLPSGRWTPGQGLKGDGTSYRLATGFNPSAAAAGAWSDPTEGTVSGGVFQATLFAAAFDHGLDPDHPRNGFELVADNGKAGVRARSASGAASTMNANANADFTPAASSDPHCMGALRNGLTAADHYNIDNGAIDSTAAATPTYAADYAASAGLPDAFYLLGGRTSGGVLSYCDRTVGFELVALPLTVAEIAEADDIEKEWGVSEGFYG